MDDRLRRGARAGGLQCVLLRCLSGLDGGSLRDRSPVARALQAGGSPPNHPDADVSLGRRESPAARRSAHRVDQRYQRRHLDDFWTPGVDPFGPEPTDTRLGSSRWCPAHHVASAASSTGPGTPTLMGRRPHSGLVGADLRRLRITAPLPGCGPGRSWALRDAVVRVAECHARNKRRRAISRQFVSSATAHCGGIRAAMVQSRRRRGLGGCRTADPAPVASSRPIRAFPRCAPLARRAFHRLRLGARPAPRRRGIRRRPAAAANPRPLHSP